MIFYKDKAIHNTYNQTKMELPAIKTSFVHAPITPMALAQLLHSIKFYVELDDFPMVSNVIERFEERFCKEYIYSEYFTEREYYEILNLIVTIDISACCKFKEIILKFMKEIRGTYLDKHFILDMIMSNRIINNIESNTYDIGELSKLPSTFLWMIREQLLTWE